MRGFDGGVLHLEDGLLRRLMFLKKHSISEAGSVPVFR
jgi:hypothetical protein